MGAVFGDIFPADDLDAPENVNQRPDNGQQNPIEKHKQYHRFLLF